MLHKKYFWTDKLRFDIPDAKKAEFIRLFKSRIKTILMFANERARRLKKPQYESAVTIAKKEFEDWAFQDSGGFNWEVKELNIIEDKNSKAIRNKIHKHF